jgi:ATP-dependent RNA helicase DeaD
VGRKHNVQPGNIVGAIANEAGLESRNIGRIKIFDDYSLVDLPEGLAKESFFHLKNVWVAGQKLNISKLHGGGEKLGFKRKGPPKGKPMGKKPHRKGGKPE